MKKFLLPIFFLTSCAIFKPTPASDGIKPPLALGDPDVLRLRSVEFVVVHKDNAQKTFDTLESSGQQPVLFALNGKDYKNLASNTIQLKGYIKSQRKIIRLYKRYYEGVEYGKGKN